MPDGLPRTLAFIGAAARRDADTMLPRSPLLALPLIVAVYFVAGKLGLSLAFVNDSTTAVWPPAGIAVGTLLLLGPRAWPAIAAGAFLVNLTTSGFPLSSLAIAAGNTLEAIAAWWLVARFAGGAAVFDRPRGVFLFGALAGGLAPLIAASVGTLTLRVAGLAAADESLSVFATWWLGDAVGIVLVTPLLMMWCMRSGAAASVGRGPEFTASIATVVAAAWLVFGPTPVARQHYALQFLVAPVLLWPAFRLGGRATITAVASLAVVAIAGTLQGLGPFGLASPHQSLLLLQTFIGVFAIVMLAVAAEVNGRKALEQEARALAESLERRVVERTEELRRVRDRLVEAQAVAHVGSWEWDVASNDVWWSDELYRIYGVSPQEPITYSRYLSLIHPDDRQLAQDTVAEALAKAQAFSFEHRVVRPDGVQRVLHGRGHAVVDESGRVVRLVGTGHDITERKRAEDERALLITEQAARHEAEAANRAKDEFLAILSHELRTPLNAALGWSHLLRDRLVVGVEHDRAVDAVWRNLRALVRLVADLMDLSAVTLSTLRLEHADVDLSRVAAECIDALRHDPAAHHVTFVLDAPAPVGVRGDAGRLQQVITNLLTNAAKFAPPGSRVGVRVSAAADRVLCVVDDEGPGIPPELLPQIFERFRQGDSPATRRYGGLGLGLAIAHHLVTAHGGTLTAENRPGGGACFTVSLPR